MGRKKHREYDERETTALLERAAELQGTQALVPVTGARNLDQIKAIAVEAGLDAASIEAAAQELDDDSLRRSLIGPSPRMEFSSALPGTLDEDDRRELLGILQRALDAKGRARESARGLEWRHLGLLGRELVVVSAHKGTTRIEVRGRYRRGLVASFLAGGVSAGAATLGLLDMLGLLRTLDAAALPLVLGAAFFTGRKVWSWFAGARERTLRKLADRVGDFAEQTTRALPPKQD